jgi:ketosteroid isomerase-like protein
MSAADKQTARDYLAASFAGDRAAMARCMTPDCKVWLPKSAETNLGLGNPLVGRDRITEIFSGIAGSVFDHGTLQFDVTHAVAEGDYVVTHYRLRSRTKAGVPYDNTYLFLFRFENGAIAECWEQTDTAYAFATFQKEKS